MQTLPGSGTLTVASTAGFVDAGTIHVGPSIGRRFMDDMVARVNALKPDLVAITGDLVDGDVVAGNQHASTHHVGSLEAGLGEMVLEGGTAARRVAHAKARDGAGGEPAPVEVAAGFQAGAAGKLRLEEARGGVQDGVKAR